MFKVAVLLFIIRNIYYNFIDFLFFSVIDEWITCTQYRSVNVLSNGHVMKWWMYRMCVFRLVAGVDCAEAGRGDKTCRHQWGHWAMAVWHSVWQNSWRKNVCNSQSICRVVHFNTFIQTIMIVHDPPLNLLTGKH